jgi:CHAT domain-containing protein
MEWLDSGAAHLMSSFYKNLKTMTKVEPLRQAQLQLIRGQARHRRGREARRNAKRPAPCS